jgi:integrase
MAKWTKPTKPYPTYPLTFTPRGQVKKYNGKPRYVCPNETPPKEAVQILARKISEWDRPAEARSSNSGLTIRQVCNRWLDEKLADAEAGQLTWGYFASCRRVVRAFLDATGESKPVADLGPEDFTAFGRKLQITLGVRAVRRAVRILSSLFRHADDQDWIERPIKLGRRFRQMAGVKTEPPSNAARTPTELRTILERIDARIAELKSRPERDLGSLIQFKAACWLAINGGYGSTDLAELPVEVIDLDAGVIDYRRGKTKKERIVPLMPETVKALRPVLEMAIKRNDSLLFRTREGQPWRREVPNRSGSGNVSTVTTIDNFQQVYGKLLRAMGMKRAGAGFYELKDAHSELADAAGDVHAAMRIVGHALPFSRDPYVRVTPDRLQKVVQFIRHKLLKG